MSWIVLGEEKGEMKLISKSDVTGMLPKGAYLTVEEGERRFILRVNKSYQYSPYSPSPLIADMDLTPLAADRKVLNIIHADIVKIIGNREDGLVDFIKPQSIARRSTQDEINAAMGGTHRGPKVFLATIQYGENQKLVDDKGRYITAALPEDMFYHQILICGKTGSGKTVAAKYLAQYFVEEFEGAVLAVNVKGDDLLRMYEPSRTNKEEVKKEWASLGVEPHGIKNFVVYYPPTIMLPRSVNPRYGEKITLNVNDIDPNALTGLLHNISDVAAQSLPNIFRYWRDMWRIKNKKYNATFSDFVEYFRRGKDDKYIYSTMNEREEMGETQLHPATYTNLLNNLDSARIFFDNENAKTLSADDILFPGKMSVIHVADSRGVSFGSILLRDLLHKIVKAKDNKGKNYPPVLIIIDEVHQFYRSDSSREALGDLDTICRTGRSKKIGIIFSSQNPTDIPRGLESVINTKIFFNSSRNVVKSLGIDVSLIEVESLKKGYALGSIFDMPHLKIFKFPLSLAGTDDE